MKEITISYKELIRNFNAFQNIGSKEEVKLGASLGKRVHRAMRKIKPYIEDYEAGEKAAIEETREMLEGAVPSKMTPEERDALMRRNRTIESLQEETITMEDMPTFKDGELLERGCKPSWVYDLGDFVEWEEDS